MQLETERLQLRLLTPEDDAFMLGLLNEPSFIRNIGDRGVRTRAAARQYIEDRTIASYREHGYGMYMVELKESGVAIGISGLVKRDYLDDADIGFAFLPRYWSRGYAFESAAAVKSYAFDTLALRRLLAIVSPGNAGSIRVIEKLGLRFVGLVRPPGDHIDVRLYSSDG